MLSSFYRSAVLVLLIFPILYILWQRLLPPPRLSANVWFVYFAIIFSGPLLLIYAFIMRSLCNDKVIFWIALLVGGSWVGYEIVIILKTML